MEATRRPESSPSNASPPGGASTPAAAPLASQSVEKLGEPSVSTPTPAPSSDAATDDGAPGGEGYTTPRNAVKVDSPEAVAATTTPTIKRVAAKTLLIRRALRCSSGTAADDGGDYQDSKRRKASKAPAAVASVPKTDVGITITVADPPQNQLPTSIGMLPMNMMPQHLMLQQQYYETQQRYAQQVILHNTMMATGALGGGQFGPGGMLFQPPPHGGFQSFPASAAAAAPTQVAPPSNTKAKKASPSARAPKTNADGTTDIGGGTAKAKEVWSGLPDDALEGGWPDGWVKKTFQRQSGKTAGTKDSYWYSPVHRVKLRSITDVKKFLAALVQCNGDELLARKQMMTREQTKKDPKDVFVAVGGT